MVAAVGPPVAVKALRGRANARYEAALPAALEELARSLRSGASLSQAVGEAATSVEGQVQTDLTAVATAISHGVPLITALEGWAERRPLSTVRLVVAALCLGAETGGAQARAIDGVAATVRDRLALGAEVRAVSSQARASAWVIGLAPGGLLRLCHCHRRAHCHLLVPYATGPDVPGTRPCPQCAGGAVDGSSHSSRLAPLRPMLLEETVHSC